jgi:hypothetical protein
MKAGLGCLIPMPTFDGKSCQKATWGSQVVLFPLHLSAVSRIAVSTASCGGKNWIKPETYSGRNFVTVVPKITMSIDTSW